MSSENKGKPDKAKPAPGQGALPPPGRDRRAQSASTRNEILEAALKHFARDGFEGASLLTIAERARTKHPTVLYHFSSKERLWQAAVDYAFEDQAKSLQAISEAARDLDPLQTMKVMLRATISFAQRYPSHSAIILHECNKQTPRLDWLIERHLAPLHRRVEEVGALAVAAGRMKPVPPAHLAMIMLGGMTLFFSLRPLVRRLYDVDPATDEAALAHADWFIETMFNGIENRTPAQENP